MDTVAQPRAIGTGRRPPQQGRIAGEPAFGSARCEELMSCVAGLDKLSDMGDLVRLLAAPRGEKEA